MEDSVCEYLSWDSEFFRLRIARMTSSRLVAETALAAEEWCHSRRIDCLYFLADLRDVPTVRLAEDHRFQLMDARVSLEASLKGTPPSDTTHTAVRRFRDTDAPALRALARISHRDSRFYFDGRFSEDACNRLYARWIENSWQDPRGAVFVADLGAGAVGYATASRVSDCEGSLGLLAVDAAAQGQGLGRQLTAAVIEWCRDERMDSVRVITQGRNSRALRMYSRCGFQAELIQLWYHRWFTPSRHEATDDRH